MEYLNKRQWRKVESDKESLVSKILDMNNIKNETEFLNLDISDLHDISLMNDAPNALKVIRKNIKNNEKIVLYTDYDTDGATGGAVAYLMLKELGANVDYYTNNRIRQGYGLCESGIDEILKLYPKTNLIITIDNGIVAFEGANYCKKLGIDLIITDHHEPGDKLPEAVTVVNPKREDSTYPFDGLCGAVVIWKVLKEAFTDKEDAYKYLDILAIGTVGDVVPLVDENRIIVKEGLRLMNSETRLSLKILKELTKTSVVDSGTLGFKYSPIFNAISRLEGDIDPVIDFLVSEDEEFIRKTINRLIKTNEKRKERTEEQLEIAQKIVNKKGVEKVIVIYDERFDEGVVGLIAGRLKEKYNRPVFAFTNSNNSDEIKGSARSIPGYHIKNILDNSKELLLGYGGHELAAGLSLKKENLKNVEKELIKASYDSLTEDDYIKKYHYIDVLEEKDINMDLIDKLNKLEPYGEGFKKPLIYLQNFNVNRVFKMGKEKNHLKLIGKDISLIAFRQVKHYNERNKPLNVNALGYPELNIYNNNVNIQFMIDGDNFM